MKLSDEFDDQDNKSRLPVMYTMIGVLCFMALVVAIVLSVNSSNKKSQKVVQIYEEESVAEPNKNELTLGDPDFTADDLDFWDMYKEDTPVSHNTIPLDMDKNEMYEQKAEQLRQEEEQKLLEEQEEDLSEGGTKTMVTRPDGTEQWIMINAYLDKNPYEEVGFVNEAPIIKYYQDGKKITTNGVMIDSSLGNIDFAAVKNEGFDFVIVRLGYRGYESGNLVVDEQFHNYVNNAKEAGLHVGAYFESQAINAEEVNMEAQLVIANLIEMPVDCPVVFVMESKSNVSTRIDDIPKNTLTEMANSFCSQMKEMGYDAVVYGNKYWLLRKLDLTQLTQWDIYLNQPGDLPDYPYTFTFWQYARNQKVDGINGEVSTCVCFIDYAQR